MQISRLVRSGIYTQTANLQINRLDRFRLHTEATEMNLSLQIDCFWRSRVYYQTATTGVEFTNAQAKVVRASHRDS